MKYSSTPRLLLAALLTTATLSACNTGNDSGATNVERGSEKNKDSNQQKMATSSSDSATSGLQRNTTQTPTTRQVYEEAADRKDRNNDGIAD